MPPAACFRRDIFKFGAGRLVGPLLIFLVAIGRPRLQSDCHLHLHPPTCGSALSHIDSRKLGCPTAPRKLATVWDCWGKKSAPARERGDRRLDGAHDLGASLSIGEL